MPSIDNRVVSISFDNAAFKTNVDDTIKSLDALKLKLNFADSSASFSDISKAAQKVDLGAIASAVDTISSKFSAMGAVAFTVLQNIVNRAIDAGAAMSKAFTLAPVTQGFSEYELKMGSIQTIMAGTGETLENVNAQLQELNAYSDQTIYSFADMTKNIGKFTNAGVSLDESVAAIKGIANVAAISGANAQEASQSMYNFGQAMSSGTVRNIDWKSIEIANMATVGFKDEIIKTAVELGTLTKTQDGYITANGTAVSSTKGFTQSLEEGWFTAEVLTNTLGRYSDATTDIGAKATQAATEVKTFSQLIGTIKEAIGSGWSATFEIFIGTFDEAKALMTEVNNAIGGFVGRSADARNALLSSWKDLGGRALLIEALRDAFRGLGTILTPIKEAFRDVFPKKTAMDLLRLTQKFADFAKSIAISGDTAKAIKSIFKGIFSVFKIGIEIVKGLFSLFTNIFGLFSGAGGGLLSFFGSIGDGVTKLSDSLVGTNKISDFFDSIFNSIEKLKNKINIQPLIDKINSAKDAILGFFGGDSSGGQLEDRQESLIKTTSIFDKLLEVIKKIGSFGGTVAQTISDVFSSVIEFGKKVGETISGVWEGLTGAFSGDNFDRALKGVGLTLFGGLLLLIKGFLNNGLAGLLAGNDLVKALTQVFGGLEGALSALQTNIKADALLKLAFALGIMAVSIIALSFVDPVKVGTGLAALGGGVAILVSALKSLTSMGLGPGVNLKIISLGAAMALLAGAVLLLSVSALILSRIDTLALATSMGAIVGFLTMMTVVAENLDNKADELIKAAFSIGIIAAGMILLALAIKIFAMMDLETIGQGLLTVAAALTIIIGAVNLLPSGMDVVNVGGGIILIGIALLILAAAIKILASFDWLELVKGIGALGATLAAVGLGLKAMPEDDILRLSVALIAVGIALNLMVRALEGVAAIRFEDILKGIITFGSIFALLGFALKGLQRNGMESGLTLLLIAFGLGKLADVFKVMEGISLWGIIKGLIAFAAVLISVGVAGFLLQNASAGLFALGAAILMIGAGFALAGLSVYLFAEGLNLLVQAGESGLKFFLDNLDAILGTLPKIAEAAAKAVYAFAIAFLAGAPALLEALGQVLLSLIDVVRDLIPEVGQLIIDFVAELIRVVRELAPSLIEAGYELLLSFLQGMADNIKELAIAGSEIVVGFIDGLTEKAPDIIKSGLDFLVTFLQGMTDNLSKVVDAVTELVVEFITELGDSAEDIIEAGGQFIADLITGFGEAAELVVDAGFDTLMSFLQGISDNIQKAVDQGFEIVIELINGVATSIRENRGELLNAGINLLDAIFGGVIQKSWEVAAWFISLPGKVLGWIGDVLTTLVQKGVDLITGMVTGLGRGLWSVWGWFINLPGEILGWLTNAGSWLLGIGKDIVEGLWEGIKGAKDWFLDKLGWFADLIPGWVKDILGISSPSKVFMEIGENIGLGLGYGLRDSVIYTSKASQELGKSVVDNFYVDDEALSDQTIRSINAAMIRVADDIQNMDQMTPVITPVIDLTNIQNGARQVNGMFNIRPLSTAVSYGGAQSISSAESQRMENSASENSNSGDINFNQVINSPTALSTNDIYRQTRSQIALAKKELSLL